MLRYSRDTFYCLECAGGALAAERKDGGKRFPEGPWACSYEECPGTHPTTSGVCKAMFEGLAAERKQGRDRLQRELEEARRLLTNLYGTTAEELLQDRDRLQRKVERLTEYAGHKRSCTFDDSIGGGPVSEFCSCGLGEMMRSLAAERTKEG